MRKLAVFTAIAAFCGLVTAASAADLSYKDTPYETPLAPIWGGLYAGGSLGGLWGSDESVDFSKRCKDQKNCKCWWCKDTDWKKVESKYVRLESDKDDDVSFIGGLHLGYNWQRGSLVYGLEADLSFADNIDYLATMRARLGYARDNFLIYATAGIAFAGFDDSQLSMSTRFRSFDVGEPDDDTRVGFVIGGGAEYKLSSNFSIGLEGLYYAFGDRDDAYAWDKFCKEYKITHEDDNDMYVVRARLTYHFQDAYAEPLK